MLRDLNVLDRSGGFREHLDVVVERGTIVEVARNASGTPESLDADCAGLWLMPGVVDCHTHVALSTFDETELLDTPLTLRTLETARNLGRTLEAGVTFARDAGIADAGVREAVARGIVAGPTLLVSIVPLCQTGGHLDGFLAGPGLELPVDYVLPDYPGRPPYIVDGVDEMRKAVRMILRAGADWIKVCTTGGVFAGEEALHAPQLSLEEVATAVAEAAKSGKSVMAHALGGGGIDIALEAGVRSIEHGTFLSEEQASRMAAANCFLVPTLVIYRDVAVLADAGELPDRVRQGAGAVRDVLGDAVRIAREYGVPIALGSDFGARNQHGRNLEEIAHLNEAGLTVEEALLAATAAGAELCGVEGRQGRIEPGYAFDALLLDDDPSDLAPFRHVGGVTGVFKGGVPVVVHPRLLGVVA